MRKMILASVILALLALPARAEPMAALTFDDGPSGKITGALLEGLSERGVPATFFLCGYRLEQYPELARSILEGGHEIGIHGYSHKPMNRMTPEQISEEIRKTRRLLPEDCRPVFFRPPGGAASRAVLQAARRENLAVLNWDLDPRDWAVHEARRVENAVLENIRDGDIILMHDMSRSSVEAALAIVDALLERGFRFVTASELAALRAGAVTPGVVYTGFPPDGTE